NFCARVFPLLDPIVGRVVVTKVDSFFPQCLKAVDFVLTQTLAAEISISSNQVRARIARLQHANLATRESLERKLGMLFKNEDCVRKERTARLCAARQRHR